MRQRNAPLFSTAPNASNDVARLLDRANIAFQGQEWAEAAANFQKVLKKVPNDPNIWNNFGVALRMSNQFNEAIQAFHQVLKLDPNYSRAYYNLGIIYQLQQNKDKAKETLLRAHELAPDTAEIANDLGVMYVSIQDKSAAKEAFIKAISLNPQMVEPHTNIADIYAGEENLKEAKEHLLLAVEYRKDNPDLWNKLASFLIRLEEYPEAEEALTKVLALHPNYAFAYSEYGNLYLKKGLVNEARAAFQKAIEILPNCAPLYNSLGMVEMQERNIEAAESAFKKGIELDPQVIECHSNLALLYQTHFMSEKAEAAYRAAELIRSGCAGIKKNWSMMLLQIGDYLRGWEMYNWRFETGEKYLFDRKVTQPQWDGIPVPGKRLFVRTEQGFGDTIQFIRYLKFLENNGMDVIIEMQPALKRLVARCAGMGRMIGWGEPAADCDYQIPLMSLPHIFKTTLDTVPQGSPYIFLPEYATFDLPEPKVSYRLKVGIVWAGNAKYGNDKNRSCPFSYFQKLVEAFPDVIFYGLQKGEREKELEGLPLSNIEFIAPGLRDFVDTAVVIKQLDLVITVDTSVAHLTGAIGAPLWVLLPHQPDWRWLLDREDSPWYPSARLFRQPAHQDWDSLFANLQNALKEKISQLPVQQPDPTRQEISYATPKVVEPVKSTPSPSRISIDQISLQLPIHSLNRDQELQASAIASYFSPQSRVFCIWPKESPVPTSHKITPYLIHNEEKSNLLLCQAELIEKANLLPGLFSLKKEFLLVSNNQENFVNVVQKIQEVQGWTIWGYSNQQDLFICRCAPENATKRKLNLGIVKKPSAGNWHETLAAMVLFEQLSSYCDISFLSAEQALSQVEALDILFLGAGEFWSAEDFTPELLQLSSKARVVVSLCGYVNKEGIAAETLCRMQQILNNCTAIYALTKENHQEWLQQHKQVRYLGYFPFAGIEISRPLGKKELILGADSELVLDPNPTTLLHSFRLTYSLITNIYAAWTIGLGLSEKITWVGQNKEEQKIFQMLAREMLGYAPANSATIIADKDYLRSYQSQIRINLTKMVSLIESIHNL